jgi:hypothetical protein
MLSSSFILGVKRDASHGSWCFQQKSESTQPKLTDREVEEKMHDLILNNV